MCTKLSTVCVLLLLLSACSSSPEDYRKDLLELGVAWDDEVFLEYAEEGDQAVMELFLKGGMDLDVKDSNGATALMYAALKGHADVLSLLITKGADVNAEDDLGRRALDYASAHPESGAFKILVSAGALYGTAPQ